MLVKGATGDPFWIQSDQQKTVTFKSVLNITIPADQAITVPLRNCIFYLVMKYANIETSGQSKDLMISFGWNEIFRLVPFLQSYFSALPIFNVCDQVHSVFSWSRCTCYLSIILYIPCNTMCHYLMTSDGSTAERYGWCFFCCGINIHDIYISMQCDIWIVF